MKITVEMALNSVLEMLDKVSVAGEENWDRMKNCKGAIRAVLRTMQNQEEMEGETDETESAAVQQRDP